MRMCLWSTLGQWKRVRRSEKVVNIQEGQGCCCGGCCGGGGCCRRTALKSDVRNRDDRHNMWNGEEAKRKKKTNASDTGLLGTDLIRSRKNQQLHVRQLAPQNRLHRMREVQDYCHMVEAKIEPKNNQAFFYYPNPPPSPEWRQAKIQTNPSQPENRLKHVCRGFSCLSGFWPTPPLKGGPELSLTFKKSKIHRHYGKNNEMCYAELE